MRLIERRAWRQVDVELLRCLIEHSKTSGEQQRNLKRALHGYEGTDEQLVAALTSKYLCTTKDDEPVLQYQGKDNPELDRDFEVEEIQAALLTMRRGTTPGHDKVTVGLLANMNKKMLGQLTDYINECWRAGKLPWRGNRQTSALSLSRAKR